MIVTWLNDIHHPVLRPAVGLNISLGDAQAAVAGEGLNVADRAAHGRDFAGGVGDEGAPAAVAGATPEAETVVPAGEHVHDGLRRGAG